MSEAVEKTLKLAAQFAEDQHAKFGDIWYERFQSALEQQNLELIHDLIIAGVQMAQGSQGMMQTLREVDEETQSLPRQSRVYH